MIKTIKKEDGRKHNGASLEQLARMSKLAKIKRRPGSKRGGRPTVMTPAVISKLEHAFGIDCTVQEACAYADISLPPLYDYMKKNQDFAENVARLREKPVLAARNSVVSKLHKGYMAQWYLEKKRPDEFGNRDRGGVVNITLQLDDKQYRSIVAREAKLLERSGEETPRQLLRDGGA